VALLPAIEQKNGVDVVALDQLHVAAAGQERRPLGFACLAFLNKALRTGLGPGWPLHPVQSCRRGERLASIPPSSTCLVKMPVHVWVEFYAKNLEAVAPSDAALRAGNLST
jgi:hypothetical protein